eukprot:352279-Chlamydomonas_euryale.AAC.3
MATKCVFHVLLRRQHLAQLATTVPPSAGTAVIPHETKRREVERNGAEQSAAQLSVVERSEAKLVPHDTKMCAKDENNSNNNDDDDDNHDDADDDNDDDDNTNNKCGYGCVMWHTGFKHPFLKHVR